MGGAKRNVDQDYFLGGKSSQYVLLTTLPSSCAKCHEIWQPHPPGTLRACPGLYRDCFTFNLLNGSGWPTSRPGRFTPGNNLVSTTGNWRKSYNEELGYLSLSTK